MAAVGKLPLPDVESSGPKLSTDILDRMHATNHEEQQLAYLPAIVVVVLLNHKP
jgi:hypothetical protein